MRSRPALLLLLLHQISACEHLSCFVDYIETLVCVWRRDLNASIGAPSDLTATWTCGEPGMCRLLPIAWNATYGQYTCFSDQTSCFGNSVFNVTIRTHTVKPISVDSRCSKAFEVQGNIRPHRPLNLTATTWPTGYNISWKTKYQLQQYKYLDGQLQYELRYRHRAHPWKGDNTKLLLQDTRALWLWPHDLEAGAEYEFQVRAKPNKYSPYQGTWSDWSHLASLQTLPKASENRGSPWQELLLMGLCLACALGTFLGYHKRLWKKLNIFIPSPAPFFEPLYARHGGDFKAWVGTCSRATLDIYEWSSVLLEVFHTNHNPLSVNPTKGEWSNRQALPYTDAASSTGSHHTAHEQAYGHLSIDTVTVAGEFPPCGTQCNDHSSCCALDAGEEGDRDVYRSMEVEDGGPGECTGGDNQALASSPLMNGILAQRASTLGPLVGDHLMDTLLAFPQSGGFQERRPGDGLECFGLLPLDPWGLGGLLPSEKLPLDSHLLLLDLDPNGDAGQVLDLDTIDSGFADSDCGSPVACELERSPLGCDYGQEEEEVETFLPSYVKQWVSYHNKVQPEEEKELNAISDYSGPS